VQAIDERAEAAARRAEQLSDLRTAAERQLVSAEGWRVWLDFAARFPQQSCENTLLLQRQRPTATFVAGYEDWQTLGRNVVKGEKGLQVLAPSGDGRQQAVHVWDIEQTAPMPGGKPAADRSQSSAVSGTEVPPDDVVTRALTNLAQQVGYRVDYGPTGQAPAVTDHEERVITLARFPRQEHPDPRLSLAREVASTLSAARFSAPEDGERVAFEATSVAYVLAVRHGMPTEHLFASEQPDTPPWRYTNPDGWSVDHTYLPRQEQHHSPSEGYDPRGEEVLGPVRDELVLAMARRVSATTAAMSEVLEDAVKAVPEAADASSVQGASRDLQQEASDLVREAAALRERAEVVAAATTLRAQPAPEVASPEVQARAQQLREVHTEASAFYRAQLQEAPGPRVYLGERGLTDAVVTQAGLGFAPDRWTALTNHLREHGYDEDLLIDAGLSLRSRQGKGGLIDRFRNRIIFPVQDHEGRDVAFIGRAAPGERDAAKYINSPETLIYRKRDLLYGFGQSLDQLTAGAPIAIVEGPLDRLAILSAMQQHPTGEQLDYVPVVPGGTAITPGQLAALDATHPLSDRRVIVATDDDRAGRAAAQRLWPMLRALGAWPEHVSWTAGGDPAAQLVELGAESVVTDLAQAQDHPLVDSMIDWTLEPFADRMSEAAIPLLASRACFPVLREVPAEHQTAKLAATLARINRAADPPLDPLLFFEDFLQVDSPERVGEAWGRLDEHIGQSHHAPTDVLDSAHPGAGLDPSPVQAEQGHRNGLNCGQRAQLGQMPLQGSLPGQAAASTSTMAPSEPNAAETRNRGR